MVSIIPQGVYTMAAKMSIVSENAPKYHRLMNSNRLTEEGKQRLTELHNSTDFFKFIQRIEKLQNNLDRAHHKNYNLRVGVYW